MYYEEKLVDNILCYRLSPNEKWIKYSQELLSQKYIALKEILIELKKIPK